jgi:hypothetical protein
MQDRAPQSGSRAAAESGSLPLLRALLESVVRNLPGSGLNAESERWLNERHGPATASFERIREACLKGIHEGWACARERDGIRYGRVLRPGDELRRLSVDVVDMQDIAGPHHRHPHGEIDLILPLHGDARFDGRPAGWLVYPPGSAHAPTVTGGRALILYLLPEGKIDFSGA